MDRIEQFFKGYATTLDQGLLVQLSDFSGKSLVFVTDDTKQICHSDAEIINVHETILKALQAGSVTKHVPKIIQSMRLSESVLFVKVRWDLYDQNEKLLFSCYCSYTLQTDEETLFKILVIVLDDEQKQLSELIKQFWN
ncbi:hypothetical protein [Aliiglaciecola lipolytica]|uniref:Uncharacterized protein n=1 Tax=Aliiglaciecola lipolytica E3 TaxID=1127673 RepID=K6Y6V8_9ALTE|nr:hypothetical protein [Aliiglaciecola lipolytica]GAC13952.1 hypothetical protein GLIP_1311 [Aliiglaciecola lipolytica E3]